MDYIKINKKLWNDKTDVHYASEFYDVEAFVNGKDSLNSIELDLLGDISGKSILHMQCHFGQDSISLSKYGARVTGVDFSDKAIAKANELDERVGTNTRFIQSDIYKLPEVLDELFDIVFTSYGVVGWLPDMQKWAEIISHFLKPGGRFVMAEFHPVVWMFSDDFSKISYNYADAQPIIEELTGTYTDFNADLQNNSVTWNHGLAKVMNSLITNGLTIKDFQEYDYSPYACFTKNNVIAPGKVQIPGLEGKIPMIYSVVAEK